ncbi:calcium ion binding protein [Aureococcus anophagefferens]|nr:calcium ion binding protein [Aureococcus anophagefferens]
MLPMVSVFQWLFDQYLVAPLPYRLRSAKKGNATTPKGRTLRLDLSGGFDSATLARRVKTPHAALFDSGQKVADAVTRRVAELSEALERASEARDASKVRGLARLRAATKERWRWDVDEERFKANVAELCREQLAIAADYDAELRKLQAKTRPETVALRAARLYELERVSHFSTVERLIYEHAVRGNVDDDEARKSTPALWFLLIYGVIETLYIMAFDVLLPGLLKEHYEKFHDPTSLPVSLPFRVPIYLASFFIVLPSEVQQALFEECVLFFWACVATAVGYVPLLVGEGDGSPELRLLAVFAAVVAAAILLRMLFNAGLALATRLLEGETRADFAARERVLEDAPAMVSNPMSNRRAKADIELTDLEASGPDRDMAGPRSARSARSPRQASGPPWTP